MPSGAKRPILRVLRTAALVIAACLAFLCFLFFYLFFINSSYELLVFRGADLPGKGTTVPPSRLPQPSCHYRVVNTRYFIKQPHQDRLVGPIIIVRAHVHTSVATYHVRANFPVSDAR